MLSKKVAVAIAVVLAIICLAEAREEGPHDMADAIRMLQELDRLYTQAARPRIDRRDVADAGSMDPHSLDRAVRLVQLWKLDNMYSYKTRPRFGKRSDTYSNWAKDVEKPDLPAWLAYARRR
ncbi:neuropeptide F isoform X2 [Amyelois transitella]|uniref:neuropeptide F isoform X2 n=1 Tax=Amyelois transitella TaxID=680683 RepID=UPI00067B5DD1|nr:neuropeptide F isoform X2 [Amyelois transitella]